MTKKDMVCGYGKVTRTLVEEHDKGMNDFIKKISEEFSELRETNTTLYNHLSTRLPPWATAIGAIGLAILGPLITYIILK